MTRSPAVDIADEVAAVRGAVVASLDAVRDAQHAIAIAVALAPMAGRSFDVRRWLLSNTSASHFEARLLAQAALLFARVPALVGVRAPLESLAILSDVVARSEAYLAAIDEGLVAAMVCEKPHVFRATVERFCAHVDGPEVAEERAARRRRDRRVRFGTNAAGESTMTVVGPVLDIQRIARLVEQRMNELWRRSIPNANPNTSQGMTGTRGPTTRCSTSSTHPPTSPRTATRPRRVRPNRRRRGCGRCGRGS